ncbi:MAG: ADP-ribose diphosphatase, partial [Actinobacteria bacterium]
MPLHEITTTDYSSLQDEKKPRKTLRREKIWQGRVMALVDDLIELSQEQEPVSRQYTTHPGAVAVVVLRGEAGREEILIEKQYRHPIGGELWEIPAGLLDIDGEDYLIAAQRELAEETDMAAHRWDVLVDFFTTPGGCTESIRIFLARDV